MKNPIQRRYPQPQADWTLRQWVDSLRPDGARHVTTSDIADEATHIVDKLNLDPVYKEGWTYATVNRWLNQPEPPIHKREQAILMIAALRSIASRQHIFLFDRDNLETHANLFLGSEKIFAEGPTYLTDKDIRTFFSINVDAQSSFEIAGVTPNPSDIINKVWPRPPKPQDIVGRQEYVEATLHELRHDDSDLIEITGTGGNGKTTTAWQIANRALELGLFRSFDWNTDKSTIVTPDNRLVATDMPALGFYDILRSMSRRFGWYKASHADISQLEGLCADELRKDNYLIVIDNAETIPQAQWDNIRDSLRVMLQSSSHKLSRARSRILVTTRHINTIEYNRILGGLTFDETCELVEKRQRLAYYRRVLDRVQIRRLHEATAGNPLFINLTLHNYYFTGRANINDLIEGIYNPADHNGRFFAFIVGPLFDQMPEASQRLALDMVGQVPTSMLLEDWAKQVGFMGSLAEVINPLLTHGIWHISYDEYGHPYYTVHPLIQGYLYSLR